MCRRDVIMASAGPDLPGIMNTLSIRTHEQLNEICKKAGNTTACVFVSNRFLVNTVL